MIVMKFGGTSLESAEALTRVATIISARRSESPFVVVSAMGKTTNELIAVGHAAAEANADDAHARLARLREYHLRESAPAVGAINRIALEEILETHFRALSALIDRIAAARTVDPVNADDLASFGERLSSQIVTLVLKHAGMNAHHLDARQLIVTDARHTRATPLARETYSRIANAVELLPPQSIPVMAGYVGATEQGITTTLGRGGSDFSAAIVGAALNANEIQIWTDVDGMLTCDPRLVPDALRIKMLSFSEAAELAYFGAKVLHPATLLPAMEKNIPVRVLNSRRPDGAGTRIVADRVPSTSVIKCVACKRGITVVDIRSTRMLMAHGFLKNIFEVFDRYETPVDMLATSEISVSLTIDDSRHLEVICDEVRPYADISAESGQAIVCVVGDNLRSTPRVAARVFGALNEIPVRMISQGASRLNVSFVVAESDATRATQLLHEEFFAEPDPEVFDVIEKVDVVERVKEVEKVKATAQ
jgi:aspartate kinase